MRESSMNFAKIVFDVIIYIFSILGGIVSIYSIILWFSKNKKITWKTLEKAIIILKNKLIRDNYYPTLIIGIGRGGAVTGALLSGCLGNVPIIVIDRIYKWEGQQRKENLCEEIKINTNIEKVLLVAGELHSGNTAKKYKNYFIELGAKEIRMLAFMKEPYPTFQPDYYYLDTSKINIRFPWMITKDYKRDSKINYEKR